MSEGFLQSQTLDVSDDRNIVLTNTVNTDELEKANYEERKHKQTGKSFRHVYSEAKDGDAARRVLR